MDKMIWHPDIPLAYRNQIVTGDARILSESIPDESIDLVFTDPVYQNIDDYRWLAETAARVLKPDRACLAFVDSRNSALAEMAMREFLSYQWRLYYTVPGKPGALHLYGIYPCTTVCLYFAKGHKKASPYIPDTLVSCAPPDNGFRWQKNISVIARWLRSFAKEEEIVIDTFVGSGSIAIAAKSENRNYVAFEICPETAALARERIANAQPPLPGLIAEQAAMEFAL